MNEHINNLSSYRLSFFEKLVICRGLKFSLPQRVSPIEMLASFEKAYWKIEPSLEDPAKKELASSTLRSIALNYIQRTSPNPPKALDKGSGVVIMDKAEYTRLLSAASIDDTSKFVHVDDKRSKSRGRPPKHFHPLLQKEKDVNTVLREILPKNIADSLCAKGSRLAHLYGLPKTHKANLSMRPILSATGTSGTINILVDKAFTNDWFNQSYDLNLQKDQLAKLLEIATTNQLCQFNGQLFEQIDGVAMGSPLGPLMPTSSCVISKRSLPTKV